MTVGVEETPSFARMTGGTACPTKGYKRWDEGLTRHRGVEISGETAYGSCKC